MKRIFIIYTLITALCFSSYTGVFAQQYNSDILWPLKNIDIEKVNNYYEEKNSVITVAVIDTGIDINHKKLSDRIWKNTNEISSNGIDDDNNGYTDDINGWNFYNNSNEIFSPNEDNHGTHIAGIISAKSDKNHDFSGICQSDKINLMCLKTLSGQNYTGSVSALIQAIEYAENNGADICNLSLVTSVYNSELYETVKNSNMLFIASSGNSGINLDISPLYPVCFDLPNLISVSNLTEDGTLSEKSNFGINSVDIAAPGTKILSTSPSNSYMYMSGTSMSAAYVSATAALIYSHLGKKVSACEVKNIIISSSKKINLLSDKISYGSVLSAGNAIYSLSLIKKPRQNREKISLY